MDHALDDAQRAVQPACVGGDVGQGEERFRRVHVAVGAAIGLDAAPVLGKGFEHDALLLAPEKLLDDLDRVVQQGLCAGCARDQRRTGGQGDKSVQVGSLAGIAIHSVGRGEPATVRVIAQRAAEGGYPMLDQPGITGQPHRVSHGEAMGHARGVHGLGNGIGRQLAFIVQVAEPVGQARSLGE